LYAHITISKQLMSHENIRDIIKISSIEWNENQYTSHARNEFLKLFGRNAFGCSVEQVCHNE